MPHYQRPPPVFPFGMPEMNQFIFNPDLPHTMQLPPYHFSTSLPAYPQLMLYPPIQLVAPAPPAYGYEQFMPFQPPMLQFSDNFGSLKRGFEVVGEVNNERIAKMPRFEAP